MKVIECRDVSKIYQQKQALSNLSFSIEENKITGLIGRNGAGKTTLLKIIAGFIHETEGETFVFGERPFNNLNVSANRIFIDDQMIFPHSLTLKDILRTAASFYHNWDNDLAERLVSYYSFNLKQRHHHLSKGMKSTFNSIIGLAARCPLTIFDEPTTGMDSSVRKDFYRSLLKEYLNFPRTIILSSHLLNEIEDLLEDILLIKNGEKCLHVSLEELKEYAIALNGDEEKVREITSNREILYEKKIGINQLYVVVKNDLSLREKEQTVLSNIELSAVPSDDVCSYLTNKSIGGIDDVFNRG
ncbi:ABC-2 type transport system ATP-binding protein [Metabacillus crassostreae]|uniref:ABC transporter ATP-binding protein n=1 Tax=Metabacillus crassostreae TaxID=929098 RepID=UPI00195B5DE3|nr:ABC transporter ATP-binding protein [Metabacillus crassostreae]MBM7604198.1 ABC-2 type transport system ATP-binding protein [Metabacillus crassostreae]